MSLAFEDKDLSALGEIAGSIAQALAKKDTFNVWLEGDIGAGKTTLVGAILHAMGLDPREPVTSPTFTYLNEYQIRGDWYAHLDFYRVDETSRVEDFGLLDTRDFRGTFIEWPKALTGLPVKFSHKISIAYSKDRQRRDYHFATL